jgi:Transposase IS66 family
MDHGSERHAVEIPRQQMVQWVEHIAGWLQPVYDAMWREMKATGYVQIDETPVKVLDPQVKGKATQGYLWFYAVPRGDVILEFSRSRGQQVPRPRLEGFAGTIQTDAYEVYQALKRKDAALHRIACLAHSRRLFYQALRESLSEGVWFIRQMRQLYRLEDQLRALDPAERYRIRREQAPAIWDAMQQHAESLYSCRRIGRNTARQRPWRPVRRRPPRPGRPGRPNRCATNSAARKAGRFTSCARPSWNRCSGRSKRRVRLSPLSAPRAGERAGRMAVHLYDAQSVETVPVGMEPASGMKKNPAESIRRFARTKRSKFDSLKGAPGRE